MNKQAELTQGMLLFSLDSDQTFAISTLKIKELTPYFKLTTLPHSHPSVLGSASIRGETIPVIDMAAAVGYPPIGLEEQKKCHIIITDCQRMVVGFMVRDINRIVNCSWRDITAPPKQLGREAVLTGVTSIDDKLVQLLDVEMLLSKMYPPSAQQDLAISSPNREKLQAQNILVVDDSMVARRQLAEALNALDIPFQVTTNGSDALDIMLKDATSGKPVNILVSDIEMPGLDGYELAFEVKNNNDLSSAYIILHTSLSSEISVGQAYQVGANEALTKFDANELVEAMLRGAEMQSQK